MSSLSITVPSGSYSDNARVEILCSIDEAAAVSLGNYYITSRKTDGERAALSCGDAIQFLEQDFADANATLDGQGRYSYFDALAKIEDLTGLTIQDVTPLSSFKFASVPSGSCRRVLEQIAAACGVNVYATGHKILRGIQRAYLPYFTSPKTEHAALSDITAPAVTIIQAVASKTTGSISPYDLPLTSEDMHQRNADGYFYYPTNIGAKKAACLTVQSEGANQLMATALYQDWTGFAFGCGFSCTNIKTNAIYLPMVRIFFAEWSGYVFHALSLRYSLTGAGIYAAASSASGAESEWEYVNRTDYELTKKIETDKAYAKTETAEDDTEYRAGVSLGNDGLTFWREEQEDGNL